jgi:subtilisin family serine protease
MLKVLLLIVLALVFASATKIQRDLTMKIDLEGSADTFINFKEQVDFKAMEAKLKTKFDDMEESPRGKLVVSSLQEVATRTQKNVIKYLKSVNADFTPYWISNTIAVRKATLPVLQTLEQFSEIEDMELITEARVIDEQPIGGEIKNPKSTIEAGVAWVKAPEAWAKGHKGKGIVHGVIDTGAFLHNDLKEKYRGRDGNHNGNWLDATSAGRREPYDDHFHGTHCHGTIAASSSNVTVGVATESEWISCKFLTRSGGGSWEGGIKCMQFMLAPTDLDGNNADSDKRPHLVSNSYGGGAGHTGIHNALKALIAGGVEMVFAAGNSGRCNTIGYPARYNEAWSVASLNRNADTISSFSSKGPGLSGALKPEISAPGSNVLSTSNTGGYRSASGTSMACPHVAGGLAILWSAKPEMARKIAESRKYLQDKAKGQRSSECSSNGGSPNNVFGYGTMQLNNL